MARGVLCLVLWALIGLHAVRAVAVKDPPKLVSNVSVEGLVFCDQCLQEKLTKRSLLMGAKVAVVCESSKLSEAGTSPVQVLAATNKKGQFKAEIPRSAFDRDGEIKCVVELRQSPRRSCKLPGTSRRTSAAWLRQEAGGAAVIYAAGALSFRPKSASPFCTEASYYMPPMMTPPTQMPPMMKPPTQMPPMMKPPTQMPPMMKPPMMKPPYHLPPWMKPPYHLPPWMKPPMEMPPMMKPPMEMPPMMKPPYKMPPPWMKPPYHLPPWMKPPVQMPTMMKPPTYSSKLPKP